MGVRRPNSRVIASLCLTGEPCKIGAAKQPLNFEIFFFELARY